VRAGLCELEAILDASRAAEALEALLPRGGRPRQLPVRSLLLGILLAAADDRPAHLTRVHEALVALPAADRDRLAVSVPSPAGPHLLTYRQLEHLARRLRRALPAEDGGPHGILCGVIDALVEASVPLPYKQASADIAVDWTDHESFARPGRSEIDPDASFGHRKGGGPGERSELFFGYYLQFATMVGEVAGRRVPELVRRMVLASCRVDPPALVVSALSRLVASGVAIGEVLADSGYSHRVASTFALPLRALGAHLVVDLHPHDRGPKGSFGGATVCNGALYCPATPAALFTLAPPPRGASAEEIAAHDARADELARYRLVRLSRPDADGYHRVACPALAGKLRCPARESSMSLGFERPEVAEPPSPAPPCCLQQSLTVPPTVGAKTAQRHDYASRSWRESYARRTAVERSNATLKDPARGGTRRGWCRLMGLSGIALFLACHVVVCNLRVLEAFEDRVADDGRRAASGTAPSSRRRRRTPIEELVPSGRRRSH
jgi:hypothetical protein